MIISELENICKKVAKKFGGIKFCIYIYSAKPRQASQRCSNVLRVVFYIYQNSATLWKKVHAGDANLNKMDLYYPILSVIREESKKYEYKPDIEHNVVVIDENGVEYLRIPMNKFVVESSSLLGEIKAGGSRAFAIPETETFMGQIGCKKIKAPSTDKSDIHIVIHDLRTNMTPMLGFSIKSQLGSPSTLLNTGETTNICYHITNKTMTDSELDEINSITDHLPRMGALIERGYGLEYSNKIKRWLTL